MLKQFCDEIVEERLAHITRGGELYMASQVCVRREGRFGKREHW